MNNIYSWVLVYRDISYKLLEFKNNRSELLKIMYEILEELDLFKDEDEKNCNLDKFNGKRCKYDDIDPFSFMNRFDLYNFKNRQNFIKKFQAKTGLEINVPDDFDGIPMPNPQLSCFIRFKDDREYNDVNDLWELFEVAIKYGEDPSEELKEKFVYYYDLAISKPCCKYNISVGLFKINPYFYINLDSTERKYLNDKLNINITKVPNGKEYLELIDKIKNVIKNIDDIDTLIDLSYQSWIYKPKPNKCWLYSPGENACFWNECVENNIMVIGWDDLGDLSQYIDDYDINEAIKTYYFKDNPVNDKKAVIDFYKNIKIDDIVIAKTGANTLLGYGIVESDYYFDEERKKYKHVRKINWVKTGKWTNSIVGNVVKTLTDISKYEGYPEKLLDIINGDDEMNSDKRYFWLNANPRIWSFSDIKVGEAIDYTSVNDNGNKRRIYQNYVNAKKGDLVIAYESTPVKAIVGLCEVEEELKNNIIKFKKIEHFVSPISLNTIKEQPELQNMEYFKNFQGSLFKLEKEEYNVIYDIIRELNPKVNRKYDKYTQKDFFNEVYITSEKYNDIVSLLKRKKNVILEGAPGVGKTFIAKRLAYSLMEKKDNNKIQFIQFHQNYSYEDFVEGYRPNDEGKFNLVNGLFYDFCIKALNDKDNNYYMIIDEINRGNLSKIFGELLMLVENDKREEMVTLSYSRKKFFVPDNLYIIGMMNTADRSLAILDYALRRRFSFVDIEPAFDNPNFKKYQKTVNSNYFDRLIEKIKLLNIEIKNDSSLGEGFMIGHSYFCGLTNCKDSEIKLIVKYDIIPMLKEYWFDDHAKVEEWSKKLLEN